jgi:hypothetical protein
MMLTVVAVNVVGGGFRGTYSAPRLQRFWSGPGFPRARLG